MLYVSDERTAFIFRAEGSAKQGTSKKQAGQAGSQPLPRYIASHPIAMRTSNSNIRKYLFTSKTTTVFCKPWFWNTECLGTLKFMCVKITGFFGCDATV
jgi:hypothetical protein